MIKKTLSKLGVEDAYLLNYIKDKWKYTANSGTSQGYLIALLFSIVLEVLDSIVR